MHMAGIDVRIGHPWRFGPVIFERKTMLKLRAENNAMTRPASWEIRPGQTLMLGCSRDNDCAVPWDPRVSRRHAELTTDGENLQVSCLPNVSNLIWMTGMTLSETQVRPGDSFRIGQTEFFVSVAERQAVVVDFVDESSSPTPSSSVMMSPADVRLALVSRNAASLWATSDEKSLAPKAIDLLRQVLSTADLFVVLSCDPNAPRARPGVIHREMDRRDAHPVVTRDLVSQAMAGGLAAMLVETDSAGSPAESGRWSICVPVRSDAFVPWCFYIGGPFGPNSEKGGFLGLKKLTPDVAVTELVTHLVGAVRSVRAVESKFEGVRQFFSPQLLERVSIMETGEVSLAPKETSVTTLYCDLRDFSRMVSRASGHLYELLGRISDALGVMTRSIIEHEGVTADFQGDSVLGFWGWPLELNEGPLPACRAALQIQRFFEQANERSEGALHGFRIGIASGRADWHT